MDAFLKGDFVNILHMDPFCIQGLIIVSANQPIREQSVKSDVSLPPSSTYMGICKMAVIDRVDLDVN